MSTHCQCFSVHVVICVCVCVYMCACMYGGQEWTPGIILSYFLYLETALFEPGTA